MSRIVVIGAGMAGHATALGLKHRLGADHEVIVVSPGAQWINPDSLPHIATGLQSPEHETVALGSLYRHKGIIYHQGLARTVYPRGYRDDPRPQVEITFTGSPLAGETARVPYDFLVVATGHDIDRVAGIPSEGTTIATCVIDRLDSAVAGESELRRLISELQDSPPGDKPRVIAVGRSARGMGGYYGALEYALAVDGVLRSEGLRSRVQLHFFDAGRPWLYLTSANPEMEEATREAVERLMERFGILLHRGKRLTSINGTRLRYVSAQGDDAPEEIACDLLAIEASRVLTPLAVKSPAGEDLSAELYDGWGRFRVDATREDRAGGESISGLPQTFRNPTFPKIFGIGSAIALDAKAVGETDSRQEVPEPSQTRDMAHLMSREVTAQIVSELTEEPRSDTPENLAEMENVLSLEWDYSLFSLRGFYAEIGLTKSKEPKQTLIVHQGLFAYWSVRIERFLERYRAKGHPLWWLLPS
ncbi:MAG: FAD-dependent oxidoreductase [Mobiluncus porci]|uniref:FAD-dependent oxidoreductase n=1 Tax=Mobiluncus TaxID=2050 RepID=UPI0023F3E5B6|nr:MULTISPECIES: FAD-dependent oxidoreductase [Mobiluncus]MCI6584515.1 FAD-dependent oxidoreductase [Mobiluncus sp.]MDD7542193.1 FAD-dependent oxidoreductase [Mobiluncus porci]MDY5748601.1 FAD-dependent oxidoreductase [Mobiluncus porci]